MPLATALIVSLALGADVDRLLLCRPTLAGDPAMARPEALFEAGRALGRDVLDYGVPCDSAAEAARAAGRAGLQQAVSSVATGAPDGSRYSLVLTSVDEVELARRSSLVATGADPVPRLIEALRELRRVGGPAHPAWARPTAWTLWAGGAAAVAAGVVFGLRAKDDARKADAATTPGGWLSANEAWRRHRTWSAVALGVGGAAVVGGTVVWFTF